MEHSDPLWWIQSKIEETEEECEARLRRISEDLKAYYQAKKNPPPRRISTPLDELLLLEGYLSSELVRIVRSHSKPMMLDSAYFTVPEKKRELLPQIIIDKIQPEIPQKKRGFYKHLQHPKNPKHGR